MTMTLTATLSGPADTLDKVRQRLIGDGADATADQKGHGFGEPDEGEAWLTVEHADLSLIQKAADLYGWRLRSHSVRVDARDKIRTPLESLSVEQRLGIAEGILQSIRERG